MSYVTTCVYNCVCVREYDKLLKATVRRKLALQQQKAIIKSYLKSVQLRGRRFQEVSEFTLFFHYMFVYIFAMCSNFMTFVAAWKQFGGN
jgi:hypothetical protein